LLPLSNPPLISGSEQQEGRVDLFHGILKMLASLTRAAMVDAGTDQGNKSLYQWSPKDWEVQQHDLEQILEAAGQQTDTWTSEEIRQNICK
jgi:hypothetical protein